MTKINPTQAALLGLLHDGPQTGGDLNAIAEKWLTPYWNMTRSQVYRDLPALAEMGYIQPGKEGPRNSLPYKITAAGRKAFQRWLKGSPAPTLLRNETVLRVALGRLQESEQVEQLLNEMSEHHLEERDRINALISEAIEQEMEYDKQALYFALMYHNMMIDWLGTVELP